MRKINALKPQDILVTLQLHIMKDSAAVRQMELANSLELSQAEVVHALARARFARLINSDNRPIRASLEEFLIHGLKYAFPAKPGEMARGVPTAHSAKPLAKRVRSNSIFVWPWHAGKVRGESVEPLYKSVPAIVQNNPLLYEFLALVDALRVGKAREVQLAIKELKNRLDNKT